jgi:translation initiation factor 2 subunit 2
MKCNKAKLDPSLSSGSEILSEDGVFDPKTKKKKKKVRNVENGQSETQRKSIVPPRESEAEEYSYEDLLERAYRTLREYNPELTGERRRTILTPPQVVREGVKKTVFINFLDLCKSMNRKHDHVIQFLMAELGASGSLDGSMRLNVKGRFLPKAFENVLRRYMIEYVLCYSCKSPDTQLSKDQSSRLVYMKCSQCGSTRSVSTVKHGFQARVTSRKADRTAAV